MEMRRENRWWVYAGHISVQVWGFYVAMLVHRHCGLMVQAVVQSIVM